MWYCIFCTVYNEHYCTLLVPSLPFSSHIRGCKLVLNIFILIYLKNKLCVISKVALVKCV
jgi:hypothetical protein